MNFETRVALYKHIDREHYEDIVSDNGETMKRKLNEEEVNNPVAKRQKSSSVEPPKKPENDIVAMETNAISSIVTPIPKPNLPMISNSKYKVTDKVCKFCNKVFVEEQLRFYDMHVASCEKVRLFAFKDVECKFCSKCYGPSRQHLLKDHLAKFHGKLIEYCMSQIQIIAENEYQCVVCDLTFATKIEAIDDAIHHGKALHTKKKDPTNADSSSEIIEISNTEFASPITLPDVRRSSAGSDISEEPLEQRRQVEIKAEANLVDGQHSFMASTPRIDFILGRRYPDHQGFVVPDPSLSLSAEDIEMVAEKAVEYRDQKPDINLLGIEVYVCPCCNKNEAFKGATALDVRKHIKSAHNISVNTQREMGLTIKSKLL